MSSKFNTIEGGGKLKPTSIDAIKAYHAGQVVELPSFGEDQPFCARLARPSLMYLCKVGVIPNGLLNKAAELFSKGNRALANIDNSSMSDFYDIMYAVAGASLLEPTLGEIEEAGVQLTDEQLMAIFNYSQNGIKALESFRRQREVPVSNRDRSKSGNKA